MPSLLAIKRIVLLEDDRRPSSVSDLAAMCSAVPAKPDLPPRFRLVLAVAGEVAHRGVNLVRSGLALKLPASTLPSELAELGYKLTAAPF
jgi:hypothetical protein